MKIILSISCLLLCIETAFNQLAMGEWRMWVSTSQAVDVAFGDGLAVAALNSGVIEWDEAAAESKIYNRQNGLSDIKVSCIYYHSGTKSFFIGYENGNIDQLYSNGQIVNIPAVKLAQLSGNKRINSFQAYNGKVYASTGFAVIVINPDKHEVKNTFYPSSTSYNYLSTACIGDTIYALHDQGIFKASISNPLLENPTNWSIETRVPNPGSGNIYQNFAPYNNELLILKQSNNFGSDSIFKLTSSGLQLYIGDQFDMEIKSFQVLNNKVGISFGYGYAVYDTPTSISASMSNYSNYPANIAAGAFGNSCYFLADRNNGLIRFDSNGFPRIISKEGPPKNEYFNITGYNGKFVITSGTIDRVILNYAREGVYVFEDENWNLIDLTNQPLWSSNVWAMGAASINPTNTGEIAIGCYSPNGLSIVQDNVVTAVYNESNTILENTTLGNGSMCINNLKYDKDGNLWIGNSYALNPLKVKTADGNWYNMQANSNMSSSFITKLIIDLNGNKWLGVYGKGLVGYNDNGTFSTNSDDIIRTLSAGQGAGNLPTTNVTALAVDFDNEIWIGTDAGLAILYNSSGVFSSNSVTDASRILVEYEGNVEKLMGNSYISDIEIDGGNRKWIATAESGVFLVSADGQEVIANYTTENSPMISNEVMDMEFNHQTGELFIITNNGMVSLRTDATYEDSDYKTTTVFPNPVKPGFNGPVTIQGIKYGSDVRITDAAGNLVYKTVSNGGTATWNLKQLNGEDAASGLYFIWTAPTEGKGKKVGKFVLMR
jgi:hypothetical protein